MVGDKVGDQKSVKVWLAVGLAVVAGAAYILYKYKHRHPD